VNVGLVKSGRSSLPLYKFQGLKRIPARSGPTASTTASITSSPNWLLASTLPPYLSVLWLDTSCKNWSTRKPYAPCTSTPSKPAPKTAFLAAWAYSCLYSSISASVISRGTGSGRDERAIADGAIKSNVGSSDFRTAGSAVLPLAHSCKKI